jgi:hypothetical protein
MVETGNPSRIKNLGQLDWARQRAGSFLIKYHMMRDDQAVCAEIKTPIAFVVGGVA